MYAMNLKYKHQEPVQLIDVAMKKKKKLSVSLLESPFLAVLSDASYAYRTPS